MTRISCPSKPGKYSKCQSPNKFYEKMYSIARCNSTCVTTHIHIFINPVYLNTLKFITSLQRRNKSQTAECDLLADYLCCPHRKLNSARHMYNFQGRTNRFTPVTRYYIVFENPSHLYSQAIYVVYNEKRKNKKKRREKPGVIKD